jgi:hypothetical protein
VRRALVFAVLALALISSAALPAGSAASSGRARATTAQSCMKAAATRPHSLKVRVVGTGAHQKVVISGKVGTMSAACRKLGVRTMKSYGLRSDSGVITKITGSHLFAKPKAHGAVQTHQGVLRKQRLKCKAGSVTAFSAHFVAARVVEQWTAKAAGAASSSTFEAVDTKAACHRG